MQVTFSTRSGIAPTSDPDHVELLDGLGAAARRSTFDRSTIPGKEAEDRFLVPYPNDFVLDFSPSEPVNVSKVIR